MQALVLALLLSSEPEASALEEGRRAFQRCYACHSADPAERGLPGPNLGGVIGRRAAAQPAFDYSAALRQAGSGGLVWTDDALDRFLADPEAVVPRTTMAMPPLRDARERAAIIAYLKAGRP